MPGWVQAVVGQSLYRFLNEERLLNDSSHCGVWQWLLFEWIFLSVIDQWH